MCDRSCSRVGSLNSRWAGGGWTQVQELTFAVGHEHVAIPGREQRELAPRHGEPPGDDKPDHAGFLLPNAV